MRYIALIVLIIALIFSFLLYEDVSYYEGSEWNCSEEEFREKYVDLIDTKVCNLKEKYNLVCEYKIETPPDSSGCIIKVTLFDETFTMDFVFGCKTRYGYYLANLYFYGNGEDDLTNYDAQKVYVDFLWELTDLVAYDINSETNIFEDSFNYCMQNNVEGFNENIHFDSLVGYIEYGVGLKCEHYGYFYKLEGNSDLEIQSNVYSYKGLLKGTLENELKS